MAEVFYNNIGKEFNKQFADSINEQFFLNTGSNIANGRVSGDSGAGDTYTISEGSVAARAYQGTKKIIPVQAKGATDSPYVLYAMDFYTEPLTITYKQKKLKPYDILMESKAFLANDLANEVADFMAYSWTPTVAKNVIEATGAARLSVLRDIATISGNRKKATEADFITLFSQAHKAKNMYGGQMYGMLNNYWIEDLIAIDNLFAFDKTGISKLRELPFAEQPLNIFGINWIYRSNNDNITGSQYRTSLSTPTPVNYNVDSVIASDRGALLVWNPRAVKKAIDAVDFTWDKNIVDQEMSDKMSFATLAMGGKTRSDNAGVLALVE